mmetsp:Transcript_47294/g.107211  ORF Transcript_47294/g.107211 Transcript_47294/m.107211 type:complete len:206 (-) Transcript_47294:2832-3449(-)
MARSSFHSATSTCEAARLFVHWGSSSRGRGSIPILALTPSATSGARRARAKTPPLLSGSLKNTSTASPTWSLAALRSFWTAEVISLPSHWLSVSGSSAQSTATTIDPSSDSTWAYRSVSPAKFRTTSRSSFPSLYFPPHTSRGAPVWRNRASCSLVSAVTAALTAGMSLPTRLPSAPKLGLALYLHHLSSLSVTSSPTAVNSSLR